MVGGGILGSEVVFVFLGFWGRVEKGGEESGFFVEFVDRVRLIFNNTVMWNRVDLKRKRK